MQLHPPPTRLLRLNILPSRNITLVRHRNGRETQTIIGVTGGHGRIGRGDKDLPALVGGRTGHESACAPGVEGIVRQGVASLVGESADDGARGDVGGVGLGEAQGAGGVDIKFLAAGDFDVL